MKFVIMILTMLVIVPITKIFMDTMTDTGGPIQNVTANTSVNGTATAWGQSALLFWQAFPYLLLLGCVIVLYRIVSNRMRQRERQ